MPDGSSFAGIVLEIIAAAIGTASKQLIATGEYSGQPSLFRIGACLQTIVGPAIDAAACSLAPTVVIAPLASLGVVFNAVTAPYVLKWQKERLLMSHAVGTALVALGAALSSICGSSSNKVLLVEDLEAQLLRATSILFVGLELIVLTVVGTMIHLRWLGPTARGLALGGTAGALTGNAFLVKSLVGLVQITLTTGEWAAWRRPTPYLLILFAVGGAYGGMLFMQRGLAEYKGVFMVTICTGATITANCLTGCLVMSEMDDVPSAQAILYWISVAMILAGMMVVHSAAGDARIEVAERKSPADATERKPRRESVVDASEQKLRRGSSFALKTHVI